MIQLTDSQREVLRAWLDHLQDELDWLRMASAEVGYRLLADRALMADFLRAESALTTSALEEKIRHFTKDSGWGSLTPEEGFHLARRLDVASYIVEVILAGEPKDQIQMIPRWPANFDIEPQMQAWLLIEIWDTFEESYFPIWARCFLADVQRRSETHTGA